MTLRLRDHLVVSVTFVTLGREMSVPMHKHGALWIYKIVMANNQLRPPPNVRRELNHLTNVITPVMGQHTVNARMHSMRTLSRFFHPIANSSVEWVTSKGYSMPQWGVYKTRIEEGSDRQTNRMLNLIFPNCCYTTYLDRFNRFSFKRNRVKTRENDFTFISSWCDVNCWNQHQASWTLKLILCRVTYWT